MSMDLARKTFSCEPEYFIAGTNIRIATAVKEAGADLSAHTPVLLAEGKVTPVAEAAKLSRPVRRDRRSRQERRGRHHLPFRRVLR